MNPSAFFDLTYGMFLLGSVKGDGSPTGCIVNTALQISNEPLLLSVSVSHNNYTNSVIKQSGLASVNILSQGASMDIIRAFGFQSGKDTDKFANVPYIKTADNLPVLEEGICGWFECRVWDTIELPSYTLFILEVLEAERLGDHVTPMTYAYYQMVKKGGVPKNAPAHTLPAEERGPAGAKYVCSVCGYVYDGSEGPFEFLPPGWKCPVCGAPKSKFVIQT